MLKKIFRQLLPRGKRRWLFHLVTLSSLCLLLLHLDQRSRSAVPGEAGAELPKPGLLDVQTLVDCAFADRAAVTDLHSFDFWAKARQDDNLWASIRAEEPAGLGGEEKLLVFVVPHSHVDPGWLRTFDDYASDTNAALGLALDFLPSHTRMRFTWMEVAFLAKFWPTLSPERRAKARELVRSGQLELTSGSWVMTDEASPHYPATIDQIVEGRRFLHSELGHSPTVEWSNDPFGYGPSTRALFALSGVRHSIVNRIHRSTKMAMERERATEFVWRQGWDVEGTLDVRTHALPFLHYDIPHTCGPDEAVCCQFDFKRLFKWPCSGPKTQRVTEANVAERAALIRSQWLKSNTVFRHNVVLIPLGDDFRYLDLEEWQAQHDNFVKIFDYVNAKTEWRTVAKFGTFGDFFAALDKRIAKAGPKALPTLQGDFFPFCDVTPNTWSGYFASRPFYKRLDRVVWAALRAADVASALARTSAEALLSARRELALFQHHDAITGTAKHKVVEDYGKRLHSALRAALASLTTSARALLLPKESPEVAKPITLAPALAHNTFNALEEFAVVQMGSCVVLFNSRARVVDEPVHLHVSAHQLSLVDAKSAQVPAQISPALAHNGSIFRDRFLLTFMPVLKPLSLHTFCLAKGSGASIARVFSSDEGSLPSIFQAKKISETSPGLHNAEFRAELDERGLLGSVESLAEKDRRRGGVSLWRYTKGLGGAYLFHPTAPIQPYPLDGARRLLVKGALMERSLLATDRLVHSASVYASAAGACPEVELATWASFSGQRSNEEIVLRVDTGLPTKGVFYADNLGLQLMKHKHYAERPIERNYYPLGTAAVVEAEGRRVSLLTATPHGVASPKDGLLEVMLHRMSTQDDKKGLGTDVLLDKEPGLTKFRLRFELSSTRPSGEGPPAPDKSSVYHSVSSQSSLQGLLFPPLGLVSPVPLGDAVGLAGLGFPADLLLVSLRPLDAGGQLRSLVVHRPGVDCAAAPLHPTPAAPTSQDPRNSYAGPMELLRQLKASDVALTDLSTINTLQKLRTDASFPVKPMDILTFRFSLP